MTPASRRQRLSRALPDTQPAAPVRIVHVAVGNFHRAHQAWYTAHSPDASDCGIAAFTGRRPDTAEALAPQDGPYTLMTKSVVVDVAGIMGESLPGWIEANMDFATPMVDRITPATADAVAYYREALLARFSNPRIRHQLAQIAGDGSAQLVVRTLPTIRAERAAGRIPTGCATTVAAWALHLRGLGAPVEDTAATPFLEAANSGELTQTTPAVLDLLEPGLGSDTAFVDAVLAQAQAIIGGVAIRASVRAGVPALIAAYDRVAEVFSPAHEHS